MTTATQDFAGDALVGGRTQPVSVQLIAALAGIALWRWAAVIGGLLLASWIFVPATREWTGLALAFLPPAGLALGLRIHRPARRRAWYTFGIGLILILSGAVTLAIAGSLQTSIVSTAGQSAILAGLLVQLAGAYSLAHGRRAFDRWIPVDVGLVLVAAFAVVWFVVLDPALDAGLESQVPMPVLLIYLGSMFAFLELGLRLLLSPGNRQPAFWLFLASLMAVMASQLPFTYAAARGIYVGGGLGDIGWQAASVGWAMTALHPSMARIADSAPVSQPGHISLGRLVLMTVAAMVPPVAVLFDRVLLGHEHDAVDLAVSGSVTAVIFVLVMTRLGGALVDLRRSLVAREQLEVELVDQARRDALTGLGNRTLFAAELEAALHGDATGVAVLYCDLDDFKSVNDSLGHAAGDDLLIDITARLRGAVRERDIIARLGGDEFGILLADITEPATAVHIAERVLAAAAQPFDVDGHAVHSGISIGIAYGQRTGSGGDLLRNADIAMYLAKSQGKGRYEIFHPSLHAEVVDRIALRANLEHAIAEEQFTVHYQPIVDLGTQRPVAVEALVRWEHPERGIVGPTEFIPLAEASGLIIPLGRWVLDHACRQMATWIRRGIGQNLSLTVNLSPAQIRHPQIVDDIRQALADSGLPAAMLTLEVTEGSMTDLAQATRILDQIRSLGVRIAIDDFGTGYSALSYLGRLPIDNIKIDRSFINVLGNSPKDTALTESVLRIGRQLQLGIVAEGIESAQQAVMLRTLGCRLGQGYFFSRPVAADALERYLTAGQHAA